MKKFRQLRIETDKASSTKRKSDTMLFNQCLSQCLDFCSSNVFSIDRQPTFKATKADATAEYPSRKQQSKKNETTPVVGVHCHTLKGDINDVINVVYIVRLSLERKSRDACSSIKKFSWITFVRARTWNGVHKSPTNTEMAKTNMRPASWLKAGSKMKISNSRYILMNTRRARIYCSQ